MLPPCGVTFDGDVIAVPSSSFDAHNPATHFKFCLRAGCSGMENFEVLACISTSALAQLRKHKVAVCMYTLGRYYQRL